MCGIVGYVGQKRDVGEVIIDALKKMEYRGYDSAGFCSVNQTYIPPFEDDDTIKQTYVHESNSVNLVKTKGKIKNLEIALGKDQILATLAIGHTRWATHGEPTPVNAHPHYSQDKKIFLAHNGIVENFLSLKKSLLEAGHIFISETDTEVIAHQIEKNYQASENFCEQGFIDAFIKTLNELRGTYGIVVFHADFPDLLLAARLSSPVLIGLTEEGKFVVSDPEALKLFTKDVIFLDDGEVAVLKKNSVNILDLNRQLLEKNIEQLDIDSSDANMEGYETFMIKEICEQAETIHKAFRGRFLPDDSNVKFGGLENEQIQLALIRAKRIVLVGCGTAFYAAKLGEYFFEEIADVSAKAEKATEFGYRDPVFDQETVYIFISQSGETADTLMALKKVKEKNITTIGVVNVVGSSIARNTDAGIYTRVGPEIAVASTKAFTSQVLILLMLAIKLGRQRNMKETEARDLIQAIKKMPEKIQAIIDRRQEIDQIAGDYLKREQEMLLAKLPDIFSIETKTEILKCLNVERSCVYLGRKFGYPVALEGALKIKEIAYIPTEGFPSGELKHGPISMIDNEHFSIFVIPKDSMYHYNFSNLQEVRARKGPVFAVITEGDEDVEKIVEYSFSIPETSELLLPILETIPLQLFAYYIALKKGKNVDKPKNLAKAVTVG